MPCMKCANGKYKYGEQGKCVYDTLAKCNAAAAAIHIADKVEHMPASKAGDGFVSIEEMFVQANTPFQNLQDTVKRVKN